MWIQALFVFRARVSFFFLSFSLCVCVCVCLYDRATYMLASLHFLSLSPSLPSLFLTRNFASMPFLHKCIRSGLIGASEKKKRRKKKNAHTYKYHSTRKRWEKSNNDNNKNSVTWRLLCFLPSVVAQWCCALCAWMCGKLRLLRFWSLQARR